MNLCRNCIKEEDLWHYEVPALVFWAVCECCGQPRKTCISTIKGAGNVNKCVEVL